jgi:hypothetical protein
MCQLSAYLPTYLSICPSIHPSIHLSIIYLAICLSLCLSVCLSLCISVSLSLSLSICLSVSLSISVSLAIYLSLCLSVFCLSVSLCLSGSLSLSVYLTICLSVYLSMSVYLPTYRLSISLSVSPSVHYLTSACIHLYITNIKVNVRHAWQDECNVRTVWEELKLISEGGDCGSNERKRGYSGVCGVAQSGFLKCEKNMIHLRKVCTRRWKCLHHLKAVQISYWHKQTSGRHMYTE